jgi:hypothetical protein
MLPACWRPANHDADSGVLGTVHQEVYEVDRLIANRLTAPRQARPVVHVYDLRVEEVARLTPRFLVSSGSQCESSGAAGDFEETGRMTVPVPATACDALLKSDAFTKVPNAFRTLFCTA